MRRPVVYGVLAIAVLAGAGAAWWIADSDAPRIARVGEALPALELVPIEGLEGSGVRLAGAPGKVTIINAFASWCLPCRAEHPLIVDIAQRYDVLVVGMNVTDLPEGAVGFLDELGNPYDQVGADPHKEVFTQLGFVGMPHTLVTDPEGIVLVSHPGPIGERFVNELLPPILAGHE